MMSQYTGRNPRAYTQSNQLLYPSGMMTNHSNVEKTQSKIGRVMVGKNDDNNATPREFLQELDEEFHFDFDPCPLNHDIEQWDGLKVRWGRSNFVNPPYSDIEPWLKKGVAELMQNNRSVFLITARTNTCYWRDLIAPYASEVRFLKRDLRFGNHTNSYPIPLALVIFDPSKPCRNKLVKARTYTYFVFDAPIIYER